MIEVCWAPMLAAFSVPLDQTDDETIIALCLEGIRYAIHVTAVMSMKTHRDAFVTSLAKFTSLHSPADIKQKNIDAIKVGIVFYFTIDAIQDSLFLYTKFFHFRFLMFKLSSMNSLMHPKNIMDLHGASIMEITRNANWSIFL